MVFTEPKTEFVSIDLEDIITDSDPTGPEIHMCGGVSYDDDCNPDKVGSL